MADDSVDKTVDFSGSGESHTNYLTHQDGFADRLNGDHDSGQIPIRHREYEDDDENEDDELTGVNHGTTAPHHREADSKDDEFPDEDPNMTLGNWTETDEDDEDAGVQ